MVKGWGGDMGGPMFKPRYEQKKKKMKNCLPIKKKVISSFTLFIMESK